MAYDAKEDLKSNTMKELLVLRTKFANFLKEHEHHVHHQFVSFLSLIELEIASRIGKKK